MARLRFGLSRADRRGNHAAIVWPRKGFATAVRVEFMRRMSRRLSRQNRHSSIVVVSPRGNNRRQQAEDDRQTAGKTAVKPVERLAFKMWAAVMTRPRLYEWSGKVFGVLQRLAIRNGKIGKLNGLLGRVAPPLRAWTAARDLRPIEAQTFREQWRKSLKRDV